ncbi:M50 family metallopeptidase [Streptomyces rectiverticillatus]|uniref:M50 family metallopeptidase n=1 Tax=Streptomyces rectiverticillatus TaxID=173860 RepID=UPI001FECD5C2|nr:M50 family metallopeptidase [Streptomyces rectiverticillatus]
MTPQTPPPTRHGLLEQRPALRPEILRSSALRRGPAVVHLVKDPCSGQSFEVGVKEHFLMSRLDGSRTLGEVGEEYAARFGRRLGEAHWQQLLKLLWERRLLEGAESTESAGGPGPAVSGRQPDGAAPRKLVTGTLLKGTLRLAADATATTDRLYGAVGFALAPVVVVPVLLLVLGMETYVAVHAGMFLDDTVRLFRQPGALFAAFTLLWASTALHELAHGVVARHFGGTVGEIGLRWHLPMVFMYCTVENYPYLPTRRARVATAAAGTVMNLVFLLPFWLLWSLLPGGDSARGPLAGLLFTGSVLALTNLVPLPPLDGYKMLGHALGMADYATESRRFLRLLGARAVRRGDGVAAYPRTARIAYTAYGLGAVVLVGGSGAGFVLLCHHLAGGRYGVWSAVVPALLVAALVAVTGPWARRGDRHSQTSSASRNTPRNTPRKKN